MYSIILAAKSEDYNIYYFRIAKLETLIYSGIIYISEKSYSYKLEPQSQKPTGRFTVYKKN